MTKNKTMMTFLIIGILSLLFLGCLGVLIYQNKQIKDLGKKITQLSVPTDVSKNANSLDSHHREKLKEHLELRIGGMGNKKSDVFSIKNNFWKIEYQAVAASSTKEDKLPSFRVNVYRESESIPLKEGALFKPIETPSSGKGVKTTVVPSTDSNFINMKGSGSFFLDIKAEGVKSWEVKVLTYSQEK